MASAGIGFGTNYDAGNFGAIGRDVQLVTVTKPDNGGMTQAELDTIVQKMMLTNTVTGISGFTATTTSAVYFLVEGPALATTADYITNCDLASVVTFVSPGRTVAA
jgi:hypothetical protein